MGTDQNSSRLVQVLANNSRGGLEGKGIFAEQRILTSQLVERYLDFGFSGEPTQCNGEDGSCEALARAVAFKEVLGWNQGNEFKYLLDIDGNAWSGRFHRLLSSNSAVLKSTIFPEWCVKLGGFDDLLRLELTTVSDLGILVGYNPGFSELSRPLRSLSEGTLSSCSQSYDAVTSPSKSTTPIFSIS